MYRRNICCQNHRRFTILNQNLINFGLFFSSQRFSYRRIRLKKLPEARLLESVDSLSRSAEVLSVNGIWISWASYLETSAVLLDNCLQSNLSFFAAALMREGIVGETIRTLWTSPMTKVSPYWRHPFQTCSGGHYKQTASWIVGRHQTN